ncbi:dolichyl-phosphate beta-glucosyltransferase [Nonomuraea sp. CA-143628]|uniref:dolichyl-phosphate beta-glucosyltransferase n=1 Tax=Nonomuraea sp. CA-143628 TaxID=3239997 RepID=UPI003D89F933
MSETTLDRAPVVAAQPVAIDLSVVIPAYNEERRLGATLTAVLGYLRGTSLRWELIVVDDGSTDGTAALARRVARDEPGVRVLRHPANRGKGCAVRHGVLASRGGQVLFTDADLATPIEELAGLRATLALGADAAIGSRACPGARVETPQHVVRRLLGTLGNRLIQASAVPGVADTQCGFKLFDGEKARLAFGRARVDGWGFDVEILRAFSRRGWVVREVPVRWAHQPGSKLRPHHYLRMLIELCRVLAGRR